MQLSTTTVYNTHRSVGTLIPPTLVRWCSHTSHSGPLVLSYLPRWSVGTLIPPTLVRWYSHTSHAGPLVLLYFPRWSVGTLIPPTLVRWCSHTSHAGASKPISAMKLRLRNKGKFCLSEHRLIIKSIDSLNGQRNLTRFHIIVRLPIHTLNYWTA